MRLSIVLLLVPTLGVAQSPKYARERARIDSLVSAEVSAIPMAGVAVAVVKGRDTIAMKGWGFADLENEVSVTPAHVFRIGSVTKQFTSAAIMQLVEKGKLSLDDTLGAMLPSGPALWRRVTLRQLLNHTSGIPSYTDLGPSWARRWREDMSTDTIVGLVARDTMNFAPGSRWRYNNTGYVLLGMIIEKVSGQPYEQYLLDQMFKPLGLNETRYCNTRAVVKKRAQGYDYVRSQREFMNAEYLSMTQPHAAGALCSSVRDLVRWNVALQGGSVVSAMSRNLMVTPEAGAAAGARYGFGLGLDTLSGHRRIQHGGGIHGFASMLSYYPNDSLTVVVLSNSVPAPVGRIAGEVARIVFGLPLESAVPARVAITTADRAQYAGTYDLARRNGGTFVVHITVEGDRLMTQAEGPGQGKFELIPFGNHTFGAEMDRSIRITFTVESGRATTMRLRQQGSEIEGPRR